MRYLRELLQNAGATYQLQRRYYWLTTAVGLAAVFAAIPLVLAVAQLLASWLGVSMHGTVRAQSSSALWGVLFLVSIPLLLYIVGIVIASVAGIIMVQFGVLSPTEAKHYALRSRYPSRWFKSERGRVRQ